MNLNTDNLNTNELNTNNQNTDSHNAHNAHNWNTGGLHTDDLSRWRAEYREFDEATARFYSGEIDAKTYKGISGGFGSYAQKGGQASMLRLRLPGGRIPKDKLEFIAGAIERHHIDHVHFTTCQTIQLHNLSEASVCAIAVEALEHGILTRGGGGDYPRNVMVSPLSGVEQKEYFDVLPYAMAASDYLTGLIHGPRLPRKLKVGFSNSPENKTHATFRDLGFAARPDGTFDVYSAGGLGNKPLLGVKVATGVEPGHILYYIRAMYDTFCAYGNYESRAKARSRFMQETLGGPEAYRKAYLEKLEEVRKTHVFGASLDLELSLSSFAVTKEGDGEELHDPRVIAQKQSGLYSVLYHPLGGCPDPGFFGKILEVIRDMDQVELRLSPDESLYVINCTAGEAKRVLKATADSAATAFAASVACIGASICQQGVRDSQYLLKKLVEMEQEEGFEDGVLPKIHISGCPSSCGTHQIGTMGFHGGVKIIGKLPVPAFTLHYNGCDIQGSERMGEPLGIMLAEQIPDFMRLLGQSVSGSKMNFNQWTEHNPDGLKKIAAPFIV